MTEQEILQITLRSMHAYLVEVGMYDRYQEWTQTKIKQFETEKNNEELRKNHKPQKS